MPSAKFDQSSSGTVQREAEARQVKYFDRNGRVFLHPSSTLFSAKGFESSYLTTFSKSSTGANAADSKVYLRDATEVPSSDCSSLVVSSRSTISQEVSVSVRIRPSKQEAKRRTGKIEGNARIGVLCAQLRRLLDAVLDHAIDEPQDMFAAPGCKEVLEVIGEVLERDGLAA